MIDKIKSRLRTHKWLGILASAVLVGFVGVQATVAFLAADTAPIVNVFKPMEYKQGQITLLKELRHSLGQNYVIPDDIKFDFKLKFEGKTPTGSAYSMVSQSGTGSALRLGSTGSSYMLRASTPSAYAGYVFDTNFGKYTANADGEVLLSLKPGQQIAFSGIDEGTTVTVTEQPSSLPGFYIDGSDTQQIVVKPDNYGVVQFVNVYAPQYADIHTDYAVYIDKTLTGRAMQAGDSFEFCLEYRDMATGDWKPFAKTYVVNSLNANEPDGAFGDAGDYGEYGGLDGFDFDEPGIYSFRVREVIPADGSKLPYMTYDNNEHNIFTVTVEDGYMDGTLQIAKVSPSTDTRSKVAVDHNDKSITVSFTNKYEKSGGGGGTGGGGGGIIKPTENPKVPAQLNGGSHFAYVGGYPDATVQPNGKITRAEVSAIFYRLLKDEVKAEYTCDTNIFPDVNAGDWFNVDVSTMANLNVLGGYPDGTFKPNAPITRAEFVAIITKFVDYSIAEPDRFPDISGHWAEEAILEAAAAGWVGGYEDGTFRPENNLTRAEAMVIVNKILCRTPQSVDDLLPGMINWPDNADPTAWYYIDVQEATNGHEYEWLDKEQTHEHWTELDNKEEKQSFLIRWIRTLRNKG